MLREVVAGSQRRVVQRMAEMSRGHNRKRHAKTSPSHQHIPHSSLLRGIVTSRLHLLRIAVVRAVGARRHHAAHARDSEARRRVALDGRRVQLRRVHIKGHAVRLVGDHVASRWRGRTDGWRRNRYRQGVTRLLCARDEHGYQTRGSHVLWLSSGRRVVVALWHEWLRREPTLLVRLEDGRVDGALGYVGEGCAGRELVRVRQLATVLIVWLMLGWRSCPVDVCGDLLVEWLLFLLLRRVERHRCWRLNARHGDGLLGARLVHRELTLPVLAVRRFLWQRVVVRTNHANWAACGRRNDRRCV
jgi:hypothetical protein